MEAPNLASWPSLSESVNGIKSHKPAGMERRPSRCYTRARSKRAASPAGIRQPPGKERGEWCQLFAPLPPSQTHTHRPHHFPGPSGKPRTSSRRPRARQCWPRGRGQPGVGVATSSSAPGSHREAQQLLQPLVRRGQPRRRPPAPLRELPRRAERALRCAPLRPASRSVSAPVPLSFSPVPDGGKAPWQTRSNGHARRSLGLVVHRRPARPGPRAPSATGAALPSRAPRDTSEGAGPRTLSGVPPSTARPAPLRAWTPPRCTNLLASHYMEAPEEDRGGGARRQVLLPWDYSTHSAPRRRFRAELVSAGPPRPRPVNGGGAEHGAGASVS